MQREVDEPSVGNGKEMRDLERLNPSLIRHRVRWLRENPKMTGTFLRKDVTNWVIQMEILLVGSKRPLMVVLEGDLRRGKKVKYDGGITFTTSDNTESGSASEHGGN
ncbi:hypothetical protein R1flu_011131 [Riccia fluitans]|uniref:Uncharacterized protein n=1 Tax=Riccia fluitans TaxID=41844 RepID=A0ABD1Z6Z0_9MARC